MALWSRPSGRCLVRSLETVAGWSTIEGKPADDSIDRLAKKYLDEDVYPFRKPGERRVILRIEPTQVISSKG